MPAPYQVVAESLENLTFVTSAGRRPVTVLATTHNMNLQVTSLR